MEAVLFPIDERISNTDAIYTYPDFSSFCFLFFFSLLNWLSINYFKCHFHFFTAKTFLIHLFPCQISSVQPVPDAIFSVIFLSIHHKCTIWVGYHVHYIFTHIDSFLICFTPILEDFSKIGKFLLFNFVTIALLSRISCACRLRSVPERTAKPTAGNLRCSGRGKPKARNATRKMSGKLCLANYRKSTGFGTGGSNFGVVVGVAACRHCGGVCRTKE